MLFMKNLNSAKSKLIYLYIDTHGTTNVSGIKSNLHMRMIEILPVVIALENLNYIEELESKKGYYRTVK